MGSITTVTSLVQLSDQHLGICRGAKSPSESLEVTNRLLKENHEKHDIFWRDIGGHNHIVHALLTILALGGNPEELQTSYDDNTSYQRPPPEVDEQVVEELSQEQKFYDAIGSQQDYTNFLVFFKREMEKKGWQAVVNEYCFSRTRVADTVLAHMYEGAFHPLIHLGLGIEFEQPIIVAEALAQAASHRSANIKEFFLECEREAEKSVPVGNEKPMVDLIHETRANETIRNAPHWEDFLNKVRDGILGRSRTEMTTLAAQFRVEPEALQRRTAEVISCCAYIAGAAQRPGKARKIDFFPMHFVTTSIFLSVLTKQPWIKVENKVRLVEWKARLDLVWYAACGSAELHLEDIVNYKPTESEGKDWSSLFQAVNAMHDDGHVPKFVRALKNGQDAAKPFESGEHAASFPVKGELWHRLACMGYDSTVNVPQEKKWMTFAGFDQLWAQVPDI